ncbi:hypothetical protein B0H14DRAFT_3155696 [Mycena olivaceomarginata]|nr:hypothetical protein B0H14DRAFT_3155696 [Mycena olivaceomarginata]
MAEMTSSVVLDHRGRIKDFGIAFSQAKNPCMTGTGILGIQIQAAGTYDRATYTDIAPLRRCCFNHSLKASLWSKLAAGWNSMQKYGHTITSQNNYRLGTNCLITIFCIDDSIFGDTGSGICENLAGGEQGQRSRGGGSATRCEDYEETQQRWQSQSKPRAGKNQLSICFGTKEFQSLDLGDKEWVFEEFDCCKIIRMSLQMRYLLPFAKNRHQFGVGVNTWIRQTNHAADADVDETDDTTPGFVRSKRDSRPSQDGGKGGSTSSLGHGSSAPHGERQQVYMVNSAGGVSEHEEELVVARADALADPGAVVVEFEDTLGAGLVVGVEGEGGGEQEGAGGGQALRLPPAQLPPAHGCASSGGPDESHGSGGIQERSSESLCSLLQFWSSGRSVFASSSYIRSSFIAGRFLESDGTAEDGALYRGLVSILWTPETIGVPCLRLAAAARVDSFDVDKGKE